MPTTQQADTLLDKIQIIPNRFCPLECPICGLNPYIAVEASSRHPAGFCLNCGNDPFSNSPVSTTGQRVSGQADDALPPSIDAPGDGSQGDALKQDLGRPDTMPRPRD